MKAQPELKTNLGKSEASSARNQQSIRFSIEDHTHIIPVQYFESTYILILITFHIR